MRKAKKLIIAFLFIVIYAVEASGTIESDVGARHAVSLPSTEKAEEQEPWTGVDVSIVGKYATRFGRPPRDPYINTDRGDLLLCVFTISGVIGGFVIGYNWHRLMKSDPK